jgi:hypothetical protein
MRARFLVALLVAAAAGCGSSGVAPVEGTVTLDGKPLANASVNFQPIAKEGKVDAGVGSYAKTDEKGRYVLRLVSDDRAGAVVGKHRVEISASGGAPRAPDDDRTPAAPNLVPANYNRNSTLTFEVKRGGHKDADFELKSKP